MNHPGLPIDIVALFVQGIAQGAALCARLYKALPPELLLLLAVMLLFRFIAFLLPRRTSRPARARRFRRRRCMD